MKKYAGVRVIPMSRKEEFPEYKTVEELQKHFFLRELPSRKNCAYKYHRRGLNAPAGTLVLFQSDGAIIASAKLLRTQKTQSGDYEGELHFDPLTIRTFMPLTGDVLRHVWPNTVRLSHVKLKLDLSKLSEFETLLTHVQTPDLGAPKEKNWLGHRLDSGGSVMDDLIYGGGATKEALSHIIVPKTGKPYRNAQNHLSALRYILKLEVPLGKDGILRFSKSDLSKYPRSGAFTADATRSGRLPRLAPQDASSRDAEAPVSSIVITRSDFAAAFNYFEEAVKVHPDSIGPFESFRSGLPESWEFYKVWLHGEARRRLELSRWKRDWIGTGEILARVIAAIEIKEDDERRNNIVEWEAKRGPDHVSHAKLLNARNQPDTRNRAESLLYRHYVVGDDPKTVFTEFVDIFGGRYDLISYLFYLRDWHVFMPLRSTIFPQAFARLGVPHEMNHRCSWDNYEGFLSRLKEVKRHLESYNIPDGVRLLDAHSFCWMLVKLPAPKQQEQTAQIQVLIPAAGTPPAAPNGQRGGFTQKQLDKLQANQRRVGNAAQKVVLDAERMRLIALGKPDLANAVKDVSDDTSLGYDIASYTANGDLKLIEVKAVAQRNDDLRFFLSQNEHHRSQTISGYVFALVSGVGAIAPTIYEFSGPDLPASALHSVNYEVRLKAPAIKGP